MRHHFPHPPTVQLDCQTGAAAWDGNRPRVQLQITEVGFEGTVPAPHLLLNVAAELFPNSQPHHELTGVDCTLVAGTNPRVQIGGGWPIANGHFFATTHGGGMKKTSCYMVVPISVHMLHAIEARRKGDLVLVATLRPHVRLDPLPSTSATMLGSPTLELPLSRDKWLQALDAWEYSSRWVLEVPAARLALPDESRDALERALAFLQEGRHDDAVHAVQRVRHAMEASSLNQKLGQLADAATREKLGGRDRARLERLELLRGALWHAANTAAHPGPDFQTWERREAEMMVRGLTTLLASL